MGGTVWPGAVVRTDAQVYQLMSREDVLVAKGCPTVGNRTGVRFKIEMHQLVTLQIVESIEGSLA